ncbi:hypothetical protein V2I01_30100 [Micromonospora sp. BRA006-A]|nr:hypothetical protein [Micromonospora sp. BRA006-A]
MPPVPGGPGWDKPTIQVQQIGPLLEEEAERTAAKAARDASAKSAATTTAGEPPVSAPPASAPPASESPADRPSAGPSPAGSSGMIAPRSERTAGEHVPGQRTAGEHVGYGEAARVVHRPPTPPQV